MFSFPQLLNVCNVTELSFFLCYLWRVWCHYLCTCITKSDNPRHAPLKKHILISAKTFHLWNWHRDITATWLVHSLPLKSPARMFWTEIMTCFFGGPCRVSLVLVIRHYKDVSVFKWRNFLQRKCGSAGKSQPCKKSPAIPRSLVRLRIGEYLLQRVIRRRTTSVPELAR